MSPYDATELCSVFSLPFQPGSFHFHFILNIKRLASAESIAAASSVHPQRDWDQEGQVWKEKNKRTTGTLLTKSFRYQTVVKWVLFLFHLLNVELPVLGASSSLRGSQYDPGVSQIVPEATLRWLHIPIDRKLGRHIENILMMFTGCVNRYFTFINQLPSGMSNIESFFPFSSLQLPALWLTFCFCGLYQPAGRIIRE